jgi:hypothetical protein
VFLQTGSFLIAGILPTIFLSSTLLLQIRNARQLKIAKPPAVPGTRRKFLKQQIDDDFVRRTDQVFLALVPLGFLLASPVISRGYQSPTYENVAALTLVLASIIVPYGIQIKAMIENSIRGRIDAWVSLISILSIDTTYLIYFGFTRKAILPMLVPNVMTRATFGSFFGSLDFAVALLISIWFGRKLMNFYSRSLSARSVEVPKHTRELLRKVVLLFIIFGYVSTIAYSSIFS